MAQTNVQVPIEGRRHEEEVVRKRKILRGDERYKSPGPSAMAQDVIPPAIVESHGGAQVSTKAKEMLYGDFSSKGHKHHMSGRKDAGRNQGLNVGSTHLDMPAEPHYPRK